MDQVPHDTAPDPARGAPRPRRRTVRALAPTALFVLAALVTVGVWALASPIGSSPDDDFHQTSIWCPPPAQESGCETRGQFPDGQPRRVQVPALVYRASVCYAQNSTQSAQCLDAVSRTATVLAEHFDRGSYPGPFYHVMNLFVGADVTRSVLLMRGVNGVLAVTLLTAGALLAPPQARRVVVLAVLGTWVPVGLFLVSSVNPSSWSVTGLSAYWFFLHVLLLRGGPRWRLLVTGGLVMLSGAVVLSSRVDAIAYLVLVTAAVSVLHARRVLARPWLLAAPALVCLAAVWSFVGSPQTGVLETGLSGGQPRDPGELFFVNLGQLPSLYAGALAGPGWGLGWLDTPMLPLTWFAAILVFGGLAFAGLGQVSWLKGVAVGAVAVALVVIPLYVLQSGSSVVGQGVQPRYLYPLLTPLLGLCLVGVPASRGIDLSRAQTAVVWFLLTAGHAFALHQNIRRYVTGLDVTGFDLDAAVEWWWSTGPSPMTLWAVGTAGFAVLALVLFAVRADQPPNPARRSLAK